MGLAVPQGIPAGFDPKHPASSGISPNNGISVVATGSNYRNLTGGKSGTVTVAPVTAIHGNLGLTTAHSALTDQISFSGNPVVAPSGTTMGAIFICSSFLNGNNYFVASSLGGGANDGVAINITSAGNFNYSYPFIAANASGLILSVNIPYFVAASGDASNVDFVVTDLRTGIIKKATIAAGGTAQASDGTYYIGGLPSNSYPAKIAAAMYAPARLGLAELSRWAADPWSFWYPGAT